MKTVLRAWLLAATIIFASHQLKAQCEATNIMIQNITQIGAQVPGSCTVEFDLSFQMDMNNGNKFIFFHAWREDRYPDFFDCVDGLPSGNGAIRPPEGSDLAESFINIGINNTGPVPVLMSSYTPDPGFNLSTADSISIDTLPNGDVFYRIYNINAVFPASCDSSYLIAFDFWSSQSAQAQSAQCVNCNVLYPINFIDVNGFALCANLTFSGSITNLSSRAVTGYTLVYADVNGDGFLGEGVDVLIQDTTNFSIIAGAGNTTSIGGIIPAININQNLIVLTTLTIPGSEGAAQADVLLTTQCIPLPVVFKSFTAARTSSSNVILKWETSTEIDNSGFVVMRNLGGNAWQVVGFVNSQADGGDSNSPLSYSFTDFNTSRNITQYRLQQIDLNGVARFSEIRAVRGIGQKAGIIIYPIPSADGRVNVVFDNAEGTRSVTLIDMSGRMIRQWKSVTGNFLQIENLQSGVYSLRVQDQQSGEITSEKIVVSRQ